MPTFNQLRARETGQYVRRGQTISAMARQHRRMIDDRLDDAIHYAADLAVYNDELTDATNHDINRRVNALRRLSVLPGNDPRMEALREAYRQERQINHITHAQIQEIDRDLQRLRRYQ